MSAPSGVAGNKWNRLVRAVSQRTGLTSADADAWLNQVWAGMFAGDEVCGRLAEHDKLRAYLEQQSAAAPTLPKALQAVLA